MDAQASLDSIFADMDGLLAAERPAPMAHRNGVCRNCASFALVVCGSTGWPGSVVCEDCGVVQSDLIVWERLGCPSLPMRCSNYKRIHHFHERLSQLLIMESLVPPDALLKISEKLCDGSYSYVNKDVIRSVLRSLGLQIYIEKYLQIIHRITGIEPPIPGPLLLQQLDAQFLELQQPFEVCKPKGRKNYLNYNYVFCRLFQRLGCPQFCMFFPLIKSKQKLRQLDDTYNAMCEVLQWPVTPLQVVPPFSVKLEQPERLIERLRAQFSAQIAAAPDTSSSKTGFRKSDQMIVAALQRAQSRRRSILPGPTSRKAACVKKKTKRDRALLPRSQPLALCPVRRA